MFIVVAALAGAGYLAFSPRLKQSSDWKAMVTPLASIMGSGFLVSAPLLAGVVGSYALWCMLGLGLSLAALQPIGESPSMKFRVGEAGY